MIVTYLYTLGVVGIQLGRVWLRVCGCGREGGLHIFKFGEGEVNRSTRARVCD
jgi:hypothetical protein